MQEMKKTVNISPPKGTRDFLPDELARRERALQKVREVFGRYGFQPTQTPAFERLEILMGKYGEDEKLIFKIQKRGERAGEGADLALRYDQTVPLARVMAKYRNQLPKIFRRYQIGPVWRADRPGRGRFTEFFQCDVDVVGARPPMADAEVILVLTEALAALGLQDFEVRLNSRKVLSGFMEACGVPQRFRTETLIAIDKREKIGIDGVEEDLLQRGIPKPVVKSLLSLFVWTTGDAEQEARDILQMTSVGREGLGDIETIRDLAQPLLKAGRIRFTPTLARGLNYYTGMIFEIYAGGFPGAVAAGGRYDDLLGMFSKESIPACGGSIGIERVLELLAQGDTEKPVPPAQVLVTVWDEQSRPDALCMAAAIREKGIAVETYLGLDVIGKQIGYAKIRGIPYAVVQGPNERAAGMVSIKTLDTGVQTAVQAVEVGSYLARAQGETFQPIRPRNTH